MGLLNWLFGPNSLIGQVARSAVDSVFSIAGKAMMTAALQAWMARQTPDLPATIRDRLIGAVPQAIDELEKAARQVVG